jgi:hypothetical protein
MLLNGKLLHRIGPETVVHGPITGRMKQLNKGVGVLKQ